MGRGFVLVVHVANAPPAQIELGTVCCSRRLMNHSCEPTLQAQEVIQLRGYFRILFMAMRHIYPGDELTIDYGARACVCTAKQTIARQR